MKWYGLIGSLPALVILPFIPRLHQLLGKKKLLNYALLLNIIGLLALLFVPSSHIYLILFFRLILLCWKSHCRGYMWALIPETIEYGEYRTGKEWAGSYTLLLDFL